MNKDVIDIQKNTAYKAKTNTPRINGSPCRLQGYVSNLKIHNFNIKVTPDALFGSANIKNSQ